MFDYRLSVLVIDKKREEAEALVERNIKADSVPEAYRKLEDEVRFKYPESKYDLFNKEVLDVTSDREGEFLKEARDPIKYIQDVDEIKPDHTYIAETLGFEARTFNNSKNLLIYLDKLTPDLRSKTRIKLSK